MLTFTLILLVSLLMACAAWSVRVVWLSFVALRVEVLRERELKRYESALWRSGETIEAIESAGVLGGGRS